MPDLKIVAADGRQREGQSLSEFLASEDEKTLLKVLTCGSVDDGKSTLIGRLLFDCQLIFADQMDALEQDSRRVGSTGGELDLALLVDGLQAEREQGITIDVAYRYFSTPKRKFIVADTPGHEQYTRNMATGASTSDLAILLVDARKGILTQTRRHSYITSLLGIRHVVLAVNKMDLVDYSEERFEAIVEAYTDFAQKLGIENIVCIPLSALKGENVIQPSSEMQWYHGPSLLAHLETVDVGDNAATLPLRLPVQWINRRNDDFRGYAGTIASGTLRPGDEVALSSSGQTAKILRIVTYDGDLELAAAGDAVTVTLDREIDVSRGDIMAAPDARPKFADQFAAHIIWFSENELLPGRPYILKCGGQLTTVSVSALRYKINVDTLDHVAGRSLALNEVAFCNLSTERPIAFDAYEENRQTGSFILIDKLTNETVGAGMIVYELRRATNIHWQSLDIDKTARATLKNQKPFCLWFTGLSGSGKSTIANVLEKKLHAMGCHTYLLDGDNVRHGLNRDLGFTDADRVENIRRVAETAKLFVDAGLIVMVSFISPFKSERRMARDLFEDEEFVEVWVDTPLEICEKRDAKGLYKKARAGEIKNFTGIDSAYEVPEKADIRLPAGDETPEELVSRLLTLLEFHNKD